MERIVLGYDGSAAALSALSWTAARAARAVAKVDIVLVISQFDRDRGHGLELLGDAETFLRERAPGVEVELHRLEGSVTESITQLADDADLVVIGINPGHPIRAAAAGWLPLRMSVRAQTPICMVPVGWVERNDPVTVGIADDDSSEAALRLGIAEAHATSATLRLVHAWLMPTPRFDDSAAVAVETEVVMADHGRILKRAVQEVLSARATLAVQSELVRDSRSDALLRFSSRSSLLLIGTHRRGVLAGGVLGSVAQEILWRADCPVCVVPPG